LAVCPHFIITCIAFELEIIFFENDEFKTKSRRTNVTHKKIRGKRRIIQLKILTKEEKLK
jgi:hypothetical protein